MKRTGILIALLLAVIFQTALLVWVIAERINLLTSGDEIVLQTEPIDPRSLFQGDYVILAYSISRIPLRDVRLDRSLDYGEEIFVTLVQSGDTWKPVAISHTLPELAQGEHVLRGNVDYVWQESDRPDGDPNCTDCAVAQISYGLESYFVPEGTGRDLEEYRNERALKVVVAVNDKGDSAIKGLIIDGQTVYEEPLL